MLAVIWPFVIGITMTLYSLVLLTFPFSTTTATVFLFLIIAFWSRLPGVGIPHPFFILYNADLVDVFSMIIAINIGGFQGAIFSVTANLLSRAVGVWPDWGAVISDCFSMAIVCFIIPFVHAATGSHILLTMTLFTLLRAIIWVPLDLIFYPIGPVQYIIEWVISISSLIFINGIYAQFFGGFFTRLLEQGVQFNWILFFIVTAVILIVYFTNKKPSAKPKAKKKKPQSQPQNYPEHKPLEQVYRK